MCEPVLSHVIKIYSNLQTSSWQRIFQPTELIIWALFLFATG